MSIVFSKLLNMLVSSYVFIKKKSHSQEIIQINIEHKFIKFRLETFV